tara:strand:+ start:2745 stop:3416 length:672 start_codon:yes stop_codon:yes gene_type:complete
MMIHVFLVIFSISYLFSNTNYEKLITTLKNDVGWYVINRMDDGSIIKSKKINDMNLSAISVEREIKMSPLVIQDILIDILNYNNVLKSSGSLKTKLFTKNNNFLDGYQYIDSGMPFISDRKYCFRMNYLGYTNDSNVLMEWYLLNANGEYKEYIIDNDKDAIYLDYGAGIWIVNNISDDLYLFSYRLFMDPSGYIPDFIIEKVNEISIYNIFNDVFLEASKIQ